MKIERIVRHFGIKFAREFKKDNPKKFTPKTGELSKSKKAESIMEIWTTKTIWLHTIYCRAYNYAMSHKKDMSNDIVVKNIWQHI